MTFGNPQVPGLSVQALAFFGLEFPGFRFRGQYRAVNAVGLLGHFVFFGDGFLFLNLQNLHCIDAKLKTQPLNPKV